MVQPFPRATRPALWITIMAGGRIMCIYTVSPQERGRELRRRPEHCTQRRERPQGSFTCERLSAVTQPAHRSCFNKDSLRSIEKNVQRAACSLNNPKVSCSLIVSSNQPFPPPLCCRSKCWLQSLRWAWQRGHLVCSSAHVVEPLLSGFTLEKKKHLTLKWKLHKAPVIIDQ